MDSEHEKPYAELAEFKASPTDVASTTEQAAYAEFTVGVPATEPSTISTATSEEQAWKSYGQDPEPCSAEADAPPETELPAAGRCEWIKLVSGTMPQAARRPSTSGCGVMASNEH